MKNLLLVVALFVSFNSSAQIIKKVGNPNPVINDTIYVVNAVLITETKNEPVFVKVNLNPEFYGTEIEKSKESKFRKSEVERYKKLGYTFDGMITNSKGKFMKFVK